MAAHPPDLILFSLAGWVLGLGYFLALRLNVRVYAANLAGAIGLHVARVGLLALALVFVARQGAIPLLSAFAGILLARAVVLRRERQSAR